MCGLTGYISSQPSDRLLKISRGLMIANQDRGTDSAGVALIDKKIEIIKNTLSSDEFITENWKYISHKMPRILLGHTRLAVIGAITPENAQPFHYGDITGTHNGVINNYLEIDQTVQVDSQVIFKRLNEVVDPHKALKKLSGTASIVWHDNRDSDCIYLVKHQNPLSIAYIKPLKAWIYNSEENPLKAVLYTLYDSRDFTVYDLQEDYIYRVDFAGKVKKNRVKFKHEYQYPAISYPRSYPENYDLDYADIAMENGCDICGKIINKYDNFWVAGDETFIYCNDCGKTKPEAVKYTMY